ncbi:MAG TPA: hypothetical protein PLR85_19675 [Nitrospira sp.]|nr:hypothetical protein [Nitrospira sp.]
MDHRHLNHDRLTLAAIDDIICRGKWRDWPDLRLAVLANPDVMDKVEKVCRPHLSDPYAQRYYFWTHYVNKHRMDHADPSRASMVPLPTQEAAGSNKPKS